ncbi:hypothetical protein QUA54_17815 [Microcoleus sp. MOSTC5]|uniref:hypothetical protein n=1 Tax=Microcoleus sp. MOSTC5 TaxID=3055378 RepID=UPI002FCEAEDC
MTHPGWINGFPGNWTYQGYAKLLVKDTVQLITISLRLIFIEEVEIEVKLIWEGIADDALLQIARQMHEERQQILVINGSTLLIGYSIPPYGGITNFNVVKFITYWGLNKDFHVAEKPNYQVRAYLNDEFSSIDDSFITEFENTPGGSRNIDADTIADKRSLYCALNSGYEVKCGKKYVTHKDHDILYTKNIETLYKLSFIDIRIPLNNPAINNLIIQESQEIEVSLARHLENVLNDVCAFLSILCDREILPIYYDYSMCSQNKYISGRIIPIWERRRIPRISKSWPTLGIHFEGNVTSFLECCPLSKQLSRGIGHLKITVYESTVELKLMAACSAIEYFYSYWLWEIDGLSKLRDGCSQNNQLLSEHKKLVKKLKNIQSSSDSTTPALSTVIRFFVNDLNIEGKKYMDMDSKDIPLFIKVRNELLHGSFISDDKEIFQAEEIAQKLGTEILLAIMKIISKADDAQSYKSLPVRPLEKDFYKFSDGWPEIKDILDELHSEEKSKRFWNRD